LVYEEVKQLNESVNMNLVLTRAKLQPLLDAGYVHTHRKSKKEVDEWEQRAKKFNPEV
jgi:hypothetical protein